MTSTSHDRRRPLAVSVVLTILFCQSIVGLYGLVLEFTDPIDSSVLDSVDGGCDLGAVIFDLTGYLVLLSMFVSFIGVLRRAKWGRWLSVVTFILDLFIVGGFIATYDEITLVDTWEVIAYGIVGGIFMLPAAISLVMLVFDSKLKEYFSPSVDGKV